LSLHDMTTLITYLIIAFIFRYFRELEDETVRKTERNWAFKPNSKQGWTAKWKYPLEDYKPRWYYFGIIKPKHKERRAFSSTLLVFTTDAEHFYQFIQSVCLWVFAYMVGGWMVFAAFVAGLMLAQVTKEINPKID